MTDFYRDISRASSSASDDTIEVPRNHPVLQQACFAPYQPFYPPGSLYPNLHFPPPPPPRPQPVPLDDYEFLHGRRPANGARRENGNMPKETRVAEYYSAYYYCYRCGRPRSKKFHRTNPPAFGRSPFPGVCRRCIAVVPEVETKNLCIDDDSSPLKASGAITEKPDGKDSLERRETVFREVTIYRKDTNGRWHREVASPEPPQVIQSPRPTPPALKEAHSQSSSDESISSVQVSYDDQKGKKLHPTSPSKECHCGCKVNSGTSKDASPQKASTVKISEGCSEHTRYHIQVRSRSRTRDGESKTALAQLKSRCEIDRRIASHPNAWSRGRLVAVERRDDDIKVQQPQKPRPASPPREPSPSDWYYVKRIVKKMVKKPEQSSALSDQSEPVVSKDFRARTRGRQLGSPDAPRQHRVLRSPPPKSAMKPGRRDRSEDSYSPPPMMKRLPRPPSEDFSISGEGPLSAQPQGTMSPRRRPPPPPAPREYYQAARERRERYEREGSAGSDSGVPPRVRFAGADAPRAEAATRAMRRERESVRDRQEARRDQREFDDTKHRVERKVKQGAGPFEVD